MRRILAISAVLLFSATTSARAEWWWGEFWTGVHRDYQRNNTWPEPFTLQDRQVTMAPFNAMIAKGWEKQNLLSDYHFDEQSQALTTAGQLKVRWILTQAPINQRMIFIQRANTPEITSQRMDIVQQMAVGFLPNGDLPQVAISNMDGTGWSAEYIDSIGRKFQSSTPEPRLPKAETASSSSSSSGSK